jgi:hypothetical protein
VVAEEVEVRIPGRIQLNLIALTRRELHRRRLIEVRTQRHDHLEQFSHSRVVLGRNPNPAAKRSIAARCQAALKMHGEIRSFLSGVWEAGGWEEAEPDRVLATVLFTDIVSSSETAARPGDRAWRELLERYHGLVRRELIRFRGTEVDTPGDGFLASFDGPARGPPAASGSKQTPDAWAASGSGPVYSRAT